MIVRSANFSLHRFKPLRTRHRPCFAATAGCSPDVSAYAWIPSAYWDLSRGPLLHWPRDIHQVRCARLTRRQRVPPPANAQIER